MSTSQQITILSSLPVHTLDYLRLALNIAYATDPAGRQNCKAICQMINSALEEKRAEYTPFDEIDENPIGI